MKNSKTSQVCFSFLTLALCSNASAAQHGWGTTFTDGKQKVKVGARVQAILNNQNETETQDLYIRRLRLNMLYSPWKNHTLYYDIRNDDAGKGDEGTGNFEIGDASWIMKIDHPYIKNFKFFRSKVDVSYSQTSSSTNLLSPLRSQTAEHASDFVVQDRRATNIQMNGSINQLAYQLVLSDGVNSRDLDDLNDNSINEINGQKLTYGGKLRYYFLGDAKKNIVQDTFYGQARNISLGLGYFANDKILVDNSAYSLQAFNLSRNLTNLELSIAFDQFRLLVEAFQFRGDLIDLTQTLKEDIIGESSGNYAQLEYVSNKWAPFIRMESFDRNLDINNSTQHSYTFGMNYYQLLEAARFGIAYQKVEYDKNLSAEDSQELYTYVMLNF